MAGLSLKTKKKDMCDNYTTPRQAWEDIQAFIPKDVLIWEAFYNKDSLSPNYLRELGCNVISEDVDFFTSDLGDCIISNPPYSCKPKIFSRLKEIDKPFILLVPVSTITKKFFKDTGFADKCSIIIPRRRIHFMKNGIETSRSWFDVLYVLFRIEGVGEKQIIYL